MTDRVRDPRECRVEQGRAGSSRVEGGESAFLMFRPVDNPGQAEKFRWRSGVGALCSADTSSMSGACFCGQFVGKDSHELAPTLAVGGMAVGDCAIHIESYSLKLTNFKT